MTWISRWLEYHDKKSQCNEHDTCILIQDIIPVDLPFFAFKF